MLKIRNNELHLLYDHTISEENIVELKSREEIDKASILSNTMFKAIMNNEDRKEYVCRFVSYIIDIEYQELLDKMELVKTEHDRETIDDKGCTSDLIAEINGSKINIEINNNDSKETLHRNIEYAQRLYHHKSLVGKEYDHTQVIQININNFSFRGIDQIFDLYTLRNDECLSLTDKIIIIQIYIPNLLKKSYNGIKKDLSALEKYLLVLISQDKKEALNLAKGDSVMEEYVKEAVEVTKQKSFGVSYDHERADKEQSYRNGYKKGAREKEKNNAINFYKNGASKEIICKSLEITEEQLNEYLNSQ